MLAFVRLLCRALKSVPSFVGICIPTDKIGCKLHPGVTMLCLLVFQGGVIVILDRINPTIQQYNIPPRILHRYSIDTP